MKTNMLKVSLEIIYVAYWKSKFYFSILLFLFEQSTFIYLPPTI